MSTFTALLAFRDIIGIVRLWVELMVDIAASGLEGSDGLIIPSLGEKLFSQHDRALFPVFIKESQKD